MLHRKANAFSPTRRGFFSALILLVAAAWLVTSCGLTPGADPSGLVTPTPSPTPDPSGFQGIAARSCLLGDWPTMQSGGEAGNLLAWQPRGAGGSGIDQLAYLAPHDRSSWYTGVLMLATGPDFATRRVLAPNVLATGDLTWSPDGSLLAFLAFRPDENVYTVMTVAPDGSRLTDHFPTDLARTDSRTSQKAIIGWQDNSTLTVIASCGEECRLSYDINAGALSGPVLTPTPVAKYQTLAENLAIDRLAITVTAQPLPKNMYEPNWSPDELWIAYLDRRGILWALSLPEKIYYPLDIGLRSVNETQWSPNSDHIAIRAEDRIFVFKLECQAAVLP